MQFIALNSVTYKPFSVCALCTHILFQEKSAHQQL